MNCQAAKKRLGGELAACLRRERNLLEKAAWFRFILAKAKGTGDKSVGGWRGGEDEWAERRGYSGRANYFYDTAIRHVPHASQKVLQEGMKLYGLWVMLSQSGSV